MTCEEVRIAAMAYADGEVGPIPRDAVAAHAASCEGCRSAIAQMAETVDMLNPLARTAVDADLWPAIEARLSRRVEQRVLAVLVVLLAVYKVVEFAPDRDFGTWVQVAPLVAAVAVFAFLKQNPFQINARLGQGREEA